MNHSLRIQNSQFQKSGGARGKPRTAFSCHIIEEVSREVNTRTWVLQDQHGVAEAEKAIFLFDGHLISCHGLLIAVKSRDQHDQGAFR